MIAIATAALGTALVVLIVVLVLTTTKTALSMRRPTDLLILVMVIVLIPAFLRMYIPAVTSAALDGAESSMAETNQRLPNILGDWWNGITGLWLGSQTTAVVPVSEPEPTIEPTPIIVYVTVEPVTEPETTPVPTPLPTQTPIPTPTVFVCAANGDSGQFAAGCLPPTPVIFGK